MGSVLAADDLATSAGVQEFAKAFALVQDNAAEAPTGDKAIYDGAIPGMLRTLDPHSNFFDPKAYKLLLEDQEGHYSGVGMQVGPRNDKTVVLNPFPGSPAYKAGIRPGDVIAFVDDKPTANLNTTEVADLLKGPRNTPVKITVSREGSAGLPDLQHRAPGYLPPHGERLLGEAGDRLHPDSQLRGEYQPRTGRYASFSGRHTAGRAGAGFAG